MKDLVFVFLGLEKALWDPSLRHNVTKERTPAQMAVFKFIYRIGTCR